MTASDISGAMVSEASRRFQLTVAQTDSSASSAPVPVTPQFETLDLENVSGSYHTVACLDVMIHYPQVMSCDAVIMICDHVM